MGDYDKKVVVYIEHGGGGAIRLAMLYDIQ